MKVSSLNAESRRKAQMVALTALLNRQIAYERYRAYARAVRDTNTFPEGIPYTDSVRRSERQIEGSLNWDASESEKVVRIADVGPVVMTRDQHDLFHSSWGSYPEGD